MEMLLPSTHAIETTAHGETLLKHHDRIIAKVTRAEPELWVVHESATSEQRVYTSVGEARAYFWQIFEASRGHDD